MVIAFNIRVNYSPNRDVQRRRCGLYSELPGGEKELQVQHCKVCVYTEQMDLGLCFSLVAITQSVSPLVL